MSGKSNFTSNLKLIGCIFTCPNYIVLIVMLLIWHLCKWSLRMSYTVFSASPSPAMTDTVVLRRSNNRCGLWVRLKPKVSNVNASPIKNFHFLPRFIV